MSDGPRPSGLTLGLAATLVVVFATGHLVSSGAQDAERRGPTEGRVRPETKLVPQRQWEYMQLPCMHAAAVTGGRGNELADELNQHGKRGWELVSLLEIQQPPGRDCLLATLKRQALN